jgi:hypothetical protein
MNIYSLIINIKNAQGEVELSPIYEVHSWAKAEEIIQNTRELIKDSGKSFTFEVVGSAN